MKNAEQFITQIEEKAWEWDISAVLRVQDGEGFCYEKAFGYADRVENRPMTPGDRFCLHAENSFFLALCVLHLMERKKLRLSDRISRFLPEYPHGEEITVQHLLRLKSGVPDYWNGLRLPQLQKDPAHGALGDQERFRREFELSAQDVTFQQVLQWVGDLALTHVPGKADDGSASTSPFLREIIRRVSGLAPREYLFQHFFEPLGMADTRPGNDATTALYGVLRDKELIPLPRVAPSDAFTTTAEDLERLARAVVEKRLFSEKTWAIMLKCDSDSFALGVFRRGELYCADFYPTKLRETCQLYFNFEDGLTLLVLNNEEFKSARDEHRNMRSFLSDLRRAWQDVRVYPQAPELKRVNSTNVWQALDIELLPEQLAFVPEAPRCIATTLARKQPAYVLMDHGVAVGLAALTIRPKKGKFDITFLQVDRRYQGRGYGRILLTRAMEILKEKGAKTLEIGVNRFNIPAQRLYRSVGFADKEVYDEFIEMQMTL